MGWYVVKFTNENSFEVVPKAWFVENTSECFWPPSTLKTEKILKLIENCETPNSDWNVHPSRKLGSYDKLQEAKKKVRKVVRETSDVSSCNEGNFKSTTKRKRRRNPKYEDTESSDVTDSDEDDTPYPKFKKGFSQGFLDTLTEEEATTSKASEKGINQMNFPVLTSTPHQKHNILANFSSSVPNSRVSTPVNPQPNKEPVNMIDNDFKKSVLNELSHLHLKINAIGENIDTIISFLNNSNRGNLSSAIPEEVRFINNIFPMDNLEDIKSLEDWLGEAANYSLMVSEFKRIGGQSMPQTTRKILYRAFTNNLAQLYSWDGAKLKSPLKHFLIARGILDAVKNQYPLAKESEIVDVIRVWMVKAKERLKTESSKSKISLTDQNSQ